VPREPIPIIAALIISLLSISFATIAAAAPSGSPAAKYERAE